MITRLAVCGLGKLGSPIAVSFAAAGLSVIGYDLDSTKVDAINWGRAPVQEPGLQEALAKIGSKYLRATSDAAEAADRSDACIFVAPTPSLPDGSFDNTALLAGIEKLAGILSTRTAPYLFVIASTVTPGSCKNVLLPAIRKYSDTIELVYKPEFIALGKVMHDLANPDVVLIGASSQFAIDEAGGLYARLFESVPQFRSMSFVEAELAKISLNCAITMKISFANQVSMVAQKLGADPHKILDFVGQDTRVGTKSLRAGMPFGGPCFPRDNRMFAYVAKQTGVAARLAAATDGINQDVLKDIFSQIPSRGSVGILGLGYKAGTTVMEESAGIALRDLLLAQGRIVKTHDPLIAPLYFKETSNCDTIIVTTDYAEYRELRCRPEQFVIDPLGVVKTKEEVAV